MVCLSDVVHTQDATTPEISIDGDISVSPLSCDVAGVVRGMCYDVTWDNASGSSIIHPSINGETTTDLGVDITADENRDVLVDFVLPTWCPGSCFMIPVSFGYTSGVRVEDGSVFNPNVSNTFSTGGNRTISLRLGFHFCVPVATLSGDIFSTGVLCVVSYTGTR